MKLLDNSIVSAGDFHGSLVTLDLGNFVKLGNLISLLDKPIYCSMIEESMMKSLVIEESCH